MWFTPLLQGAAALLQPPASNIGAIVRKIPWTRQPQGAVEVDWSNPLTRGLQSLWRFDQLLDVRTNKRFSITSTTGMTPSAPSLGGRGIKRTTVTSGLGYIDLDAALTSDFTLMTVHIPSSLSSPGSLLDDDPNPAPRKFQFRVAATSGNIEFLFWNTIGAVFTASVAGGAVGKLCVSTAVKEGASITVYNNGIGSSAVTVTGTPQSGTTVVRAFNRKVGTFTDYQGTQIYSAWFNRALSDNEIKSISANPWQIFTPVKRTIGAVISGVTISRPSSDVTTTGWTASSGSVLYDMIDEVTPSDTDYIISPDVNGTPGPATFGITPTQASSNLVVSVRAKKTGISGQIRVVMRDSGNTAIGTSGWQSLTSAFVTYAISVATTGTAARVSIEVQP